MKSQFLSLLLLASLAQFSQARTVAENLKKFGIDYSPVERISRNCNLGKTSKDGTELWPNRHISDQLFESDILLTPSQANRLSKISNSRRFKRAVIRNSGTNRWNAENVPYIFDESLSVDKISTIRKAIAHWESKTCIRFVENGAGTTKLDFFDGGGCYSYVGKTDYEKQPISIGFWCEFGNAVHEIGHALGFFHEQSRPDRDDFVKIIWGNIADGRENNFVKYNFTQVNDFGVPYDYGSIMHYPGTAFTINGENTIIALDKKYQSKMGQRNGLSKDDILAEMNRAYCNSSTSTTVKSPSKSANKKAEATTMSPVKSRTTTTPNSAALSSFSIVVFLCSLLFPLNFS